MDTGNWADAGGRRYPAGLIDIRRTNVHLDERKPNGRQCYSAWNLFTPVPTRLERAYCAAGEQRLLPARAHHRRQRRVVGRGSPRGARRRRRDGCRGGGHRLPALRPRRGQGAGNIGPRWRFPRGERPRAPAVRKGPLLKVLRQGLRLKVRCEERCLVTARATISGAAARRLGLRSRGARTPVGFARERLSKPGWARVPVHFSKRQRLRRARRLAVRLHVTVTSGGHRYSFTREVKLVRGRTCSLRVALTQGNSTRISSAPRRPLAATGVAHHGVTRARGSAPEDDPHRARGLGALEPAGQARARVLWIRAGRLHRELELPALQLERALRGRAREVHRSGSAIRAGHVQASDVHLLHAFLGGGELDRRRALGGDLAEVGAGLEGSLGQGDRA